MTSINKPTPLPVIPDTIPQELKDYPQWVCWKYVYKPEGEKWTKPPCSAHTGYKTDNTDPSSYASFDQTYKVYQKGGFDGIGFCLTEDDPFAGIDLDHCISDDETLTPEAMQTMTLLSSYTEVSPSGTGLRIIIKGRLPAAVKRKEIEMYDRGRYLTITGQVWGGPHAD